MAKMQEEIEKISNSPVPSKQMTKTVTWDEEKEKKWDFLDPTK
jgi:hypothetical protein